MVAGAIGKQVLAVLAIMFVSASAGADEPKEAPKSLDGLQFKSVDKLTGGALPGGVSMIHWTVRFKGNEFNWQHTDVIELGTFTWDPKAGTVTGGRKGAPDRKYTGKYDAATKTLTWESKKYTLVEPESPKDKK